MAEHTERVTLTEPELRAVLEHLPLDFDEDDPLGTAFRKLAAALGLATSYNNRMLGRRA